MSKPWKTKEERMAELEQITNQLEEGRYTDCVDETDHQSRGSAY